MTCGLANPRVPDPLNQGPDHSDARFLVVLASILFGALAFIALIIRAIWVADSGLRLRPYFWPTRREIGLRPVGKSPAHRVVVKPSDYIGLCFYSILDSWFRSAAFANYEYGMAERVPKGWVQFFNFWQVDFHSHFAWLFLFALCCLFVVICAIMLKTNRYDIWYNNMPVPRKVVLCLRAGFTVVRFCEGFFIAIAYLFFDSWVCEYVNQSSDRFMTADCDSSLKCYGGGHIAITAIGAILLFCQYLIHMVPTRSPVSPNSLFALGIPHLAPATVYFRLGLAWSGKVMVHLDLCGSLWLSTFCNFLLIVSMVLALDSRRLYMPIIPFLFVGFNELFSLFYNVFAVAVYGYEHDATCAWLLLALLLVGLFGLIILVALRAQNYVEDEKYRIQALPPKPAPIPPPKDHLAYFSVTTDDHRKYRYQWKKDGADIEGANQSVLMLPQSTVDPTSIVCVKLNRRDLDEYPNITQQPDSFKTVPRALITLAVGTDGEQNVQFQWYKDGVPLPGKTSPLLTLGSVGDEDLGEYQCIIRNDLGNAVSTEPATVDFTEEEWDRRQRADEAKRRRERLEADERRRQAEQAERDRIAELERLRKEADDAERQRQEEEERKRLAEAERRRREAEDAELARLAAEEAERKRIEDERKRRDEELRREQEEAERKRREEEERQLAALLEEASREAQREMDRSQVVEPRVVKTGFAEIELAWDAPDVSEEDQLIYRVTVGEWDDDPSDDDPPEHFVIYPNPAGGRTKFKFDLFHDEPIVPQEGYQFMVEYGFLNENEHLNPGPDGRRRVVHPAPPVVKRRSVVMAEAGAGAGAGGAAADATPSVLSEGEIVELNEYGRPLYPTEEYNGKTWYGTGGPVVTATTNKPDKPCIVIYGGVPRIWMLRPFEFITGKAVLQGGLLQDLPEVVALMKQLQDSTDYTILIEGHVNFGQKEPDALHLSERRSNTIRRKLEDLGVKAEILKCVGLGYSRPRFPRGSKQSKKNRRVEFVLLQPGDPVERPRRRK